ncbi:hypothetical protein F3J16_16960 [Burkholderia sp. Ap-962]|uniref:hypothetical protein n=1 Tax=Burkholderia sp. Ap-962 TaxID=2608333 RepID=UPI00141DD57F|nr:hypothetical protein [Burkholderia sp. Ap-962]NIF71863.1 hypothetical protein [Burkholderia sp. Ap-962]
MRIIASLAALFLCLSFAGETKADDANKCQSPYLIFFSNGILNALDDMVAARNVLKSKIGTSFNEVPIDYANLQNKTGGIVDDLTRVYKQKLSENANLNWTILTRAIIGLSAGMDPSLFSQAQQAVNEVNAANAGRIAGDVSTTTAYADANVQTQVAQVSDAILKDGKRVLIVSHSQGVLYSNSVYQKVTAIAGVKPDNIKVVGVGNPAAKILGAGSYVTSDSDAVIGALRLATGNVLPSNVSIPFNPDDISGHLFLKTYINPALPAEAMIMSGIYSALKQISEPEVTYDWIVKQRISIAGGLMGGETDATFIPNQSCAGIFIAYAYCNPGGTADFLRNAAGNSFDPTKQFYAAEADKVVSRLSPYSADASNTDSGLYRLVTANWPVVAEAIQIEGVGNDITTKWGSNYYDAGMNFPATPPDPMVLPSNFSESFPRTHVVYHAKLEDSLRSAVNKLPPGKAYLEVYDENSYLQSLPGWPEYQFIVVNRMVKLKVCKAATST